MNELPEIDIEFLEEKGYKYQLVAYQAGIYLIVQNFDFPEAYNTQVADVMIMIPAGYPNSPLDMFWTYPSIKLKDGNWPAASAHHETHNGQSWQRWSRHIEWRPNIDNLRSFFSSMRNEIDKGK